jgi:hypothetical protein
MAKSSTDRDGSVMACYGFRRLGLGVPPLRPGLRPSLCGGLLTGPPTAERVLRILQDAGISGD